MRSLVNTAAAGLTFLFFFLGAAADARATLGLHRLQGVSVDGAPSQDCQNLRDALTATTDATAANPYALRLEPGEYDRGASAVVPSNHARSPGE